MNKALAPITALLLSVSILLTGQGLQGILLPVRATLEDFPGLAIGAMGAAYFFGFTVGCLRGGELVKRVGHTRVFLAMSAIASAIPLLHALIVQPYFWGLMRMITGFCFATLYIVIESWLNDQADNSNRGLIFSTYSMITLSVLAAGQMTALIYNPASLEPFIIASILVSVGAVPVALSTSPPPEEPVKISINLRELFHTSPSGTMACLATGLANGSFWALAPVFATNVGGVELAAWFMTAAVVGGAAAQWPLGILSDKVGRRPILVAVSTAGCIVAFAIFLAGPTLQFVSASILGMLWGALAFPLYTIAVAYTNDFAEPGDFVMVSAGLLLMYGVGATIGPFIASALMFGGHNGALFAFTAAVHLVLVVFVLVSYLRRHAVAKQPIAFADALSATQTVSHVFEEDYAAPETNQTMANS